MTSAVVVGAGFSGWLSALALRSRFDIVTLVERDEMLDTRMPRRGVPQGTQLHNLLGRAQLHLEEIAPGFLAALEHEGCGRGSVSNETDVYELGIDMPKRALGLNIYCAPRPLIDHVLSSFAEDITLLDGVTVTGLTGTPERITGVTYQSEGRSSELDADLVVDASGPAAVGSRWFEGHGISVPEVHVEVDQWYVSVIVALDPAVDDGRFIMTFPVGVETRGGLLSPRGDGTYYLSLSGRSSDIAPVGFDAVVDFAGTLGSPAIAEHLRMSRLIEEPRRFRKFAARWRRFDQIAQPIGLAVLGDSVAALNPLFGQGMSVSAWQVSVLSQFDLTRPGWEDSFAGAASRIVSEAWNLGRATGEAIERPGPSGEIVDLTEALATEIREDPILHERYVKMWHLLEPAAFLKSPEVVRRLFDRHASLNS